MLSIHSIHPQSSCHVVIRATSFFSRRRHRLDLIANSRLHTDSVTKAKKKYIHVCGPHQRTKRGEEGKKKKDIDPPPLLAVTVLY